MKKLMTTSTIFLVPLLAMAHKGHGEFHNTVWHYVFSFWHILPVLLMVMLIIYALRRFVNRDTTSIK